MSLQDQIAADAAVYFSASDFAVAVSYTPAGGAAESVNVSLGPEQREEQTGVDGQMLYRRRQMTLSADALAADPAEHDTCIIDSETWAVESLSQKGEFTITVQIVRHEAVRRTGEQHRIERS